MPAPESEYYDAYWRRQGWETQPSAKLRELFEVYIGDQDHCLDVGCGDGGTSGVWLNHHAGHYVGVDISAGAVARARERGLDARQVQDAGQLPFEDDSFDVAVCIEVLEHLFDPNAALTEIARALGPGGRLIVTVPNVAHWRTRLDLALLGRWNPRGDELSPHEPWRDPHLRFFTTRSLASLLHKSGFDVMHSGGLPTGILGYLPIVRRLAGSTHGRPATRRLVDSHPSLLAGYLYAIGGVRRPPI